MTASTRPGDRLIAIVESFLDAPRQSLSEVGATCGLDPSTAIRYLRQLTEHGWLERDEESRTYTLGVRLVTIGHAARTARPVRARVLPYMHDLLGTFDETINLAVLQAGEVVIIEALESGRSIRSGASVGDRDTWLTSSLGKSILANMQEDERRVILDANPPVRRTPGTRMTEPEILADLDEIRERGYALDDEEEEVGMKCVGVPIRDDRGRSTYALSISGPAPRMNARFEEVVQALLQVAQAVNGERAGAL